MHLSVPWATRPCTSPSIPAIPGSHERTRFALGIPVWPTDANFVLAEIGACQDERLLHEGVIVRPLKGFGMPEHVRISVGLPEENERLVKALRRLRESGS